MIAGRYIAPAGGSEHQTGLAVDIVTPSYQILDDGYANTAAAQWLLENAADYGFILRYPRDKAEITGIWFEPWHYRYVGRKPPGQSWSGASAWRNTWRKPVFRRRISPEAKGFTAGNRCGTSPGCSIMSFGRN